MLNLGSDTNLCAGEILTLDATTANATYLWQNNATTPTFQVFQQGSYWAEITVNNCSTRDSIQVNYIPFPIVNLGKDTNLCLGESLTLDARTSNASYLWQNNATTPTFQVFQQGSYWVLVTVNNCSSTDTILITQERCEVLLEMPTVFTPNKDGYNDILFPIVSKGIVNMQTVIYNRWGNTVFETTKLSIEWDGKNVSDGSYFWLVHYTDIYGNENSLKGHLTILR